MSWFELSNRYDGDRTITIGGAVKLPWPFPLVSSVLGKPGDTAQ